MASLPQPCNWGFRNRAYPTPLKRLSKNLAWPLLRRGKNLELTDVGARLLRQAQAMLGLAESMRQEASDAQGMKRGTLRIGSFGPTASLRLLPPVLEKYRAVYPALKSTWMKARTARWPNGSQTTVWTLVL